MFHFLNKRRSPISLVLCVSIVTFIEYYILYQVEGKTPTGGRELVHLRKNMWRLIESMQIIAFSDSWNLQGPFVFPLICIAYCI